MRAYSVRNLLPPLFFLIAITMLVVGFGLLAFGAPDITVDLHRARASNDELFQNALEGDLARRQWQHYLLVGGLFLSSVMMVIAGFQIMNRR